MAGRHATMLVCLQSGHRNTGSAMQCDGCGTACNWMEGEWLTRGGGAQLTRTFIGVVDAPEDADEDGPAYSRLHCKMNWAASTALCKPPEQCGCGFHPLPGSRVQDGEASSASRHAFSQKEGARPGTHDAWF